MSAVFLDLTASDTICHAGLLGKLHSISIYTVQVPSFLVCSECRGSIKKLLLAQHGCTPALTIRYSQSPAAKFLSYQLINTQPCSLHVLDFRPRLNHPRWLSVFTNTALPTLCWKLTTDICHIVTVLKTSQIWPVYADYRGTLLKPRFWSLKMQNLSFTFMNIGYTLILSHFIDESHQIYVADHEPQSQALSINKV